MLTSSFGGEGKSEGSYKLHDPQSETSRAEAAWSVSVSAGMISRAAPGARHRQGHTHPWHHANLSGEPGHATAQGLIHQEQTRSENHSLSKIICASL